MGTQKYLLLIILPLLALGGCSSILTRKTPAPVQYQLTYNAPQDHCSETFGKVLRVWDFSAVSPYDQRPMVVEKPDGESLSSNKYQWVAQPGKMVAQNLRRDISLGRLFTETEGSGSPTQTSLNMTGQVFQFVWLQGKTSSDANLEVQVTLLESGSNPQILFRKTYNLKSPSYSEGNSEAFAKAMSSLMAQLSENVRNDLCNVAKSQQQKADGGRSS